MATDTAPPKAGISAKVANGGVAGLVTLLITGVLSAAIPAWRTGIPTMWEPFIDGGAALIAYYGVAYWSTHRASFTEIVTALSAAKAILAAEGDAVAQAGNVSGALAAATVPKRPGRPVPDRPQA